ncbi:hypothetical protein [uncultured Sneathiella sp.]|uniref:hypothetical protein n=1 Tax=uncultured Sneathiella sp. TaxID=879315 RepID=UPI0030ED6395|tara:strand:+ start:5852 stop:6511 length:660 start_codon:yes stop_codon:yes gene_type:complete
MKKLLAALFLSMILAQPVIADENRFKTLHVLADLSASNPIVSSETYSQLIAYRVSEAILAMNYGDYVSFTTFGNLRLDDQLRVRVRLTKRNKPEAVAKKIAQLILSIPTGDIQAQQSTEIVAQLEWGSFNCAARDQLLIATDGIEASGFVPSPKKLLNGSAVLPEPMEPGYLEGCTVTMLGIGKAENGSWPGPQVRNLTKAWKNYMTAAKADFTALPNP